MIPRDYITEWRSEAPWVEDSQIEQDLVISKALVDIFSHPLLSRALAFRGGTAPYKLFIRPPARYSVRIPLNVTTDSAGRDQCALRASRRWRPLEGQQGRPARLGTTISSIHGRRSCCATGRPAASTCPARTSVGVHV